MTGARTTPPSSSTMPPGAVVVVACPERGKVDRAHRRPAQLDSSCSAAARAPSPAMEHTRPARPPPAAAWRRRALAARRARRSKTYPAIGGPRASPAEHGRRAGAQAADLPGLALMPARQAPKRESPSARERARRTGRRCHAARRRSAAAESRPVGHRYSCWPDRLMLVQDPMAGRAEG